MDAALKKGQASFFLSLRIQKNHVVVREQVGLNEQQPERRQDGDEDREEYSDRAALHPPDDNKTTKKQAANK